MREFREWIINTKLAQSIDKAVRDPGKAAGTVAKCIIIALPPATALLAAGYSAVQRYYEEDADPYTNLTPEALALGALVYDTVANFYKIYDFEAYKGRSSELPVTDPSISEAKFDYNPFVKPTLFRSILTGSFFSFSVVEGGLIWMLNTATCKGNPVASGFLLFFDLIGAGIIAVSTYNICSHDFDSLKDIRVSPIGIQFINSYRNEMLELYNGNQDILKQEIIKEFPGGELDGLIQEVIPRLIKYDGKIPMVFAEVRRAKKTFAPPSDAQLAQEKFDEYKNALVEIRKKHEEKINIQGPQEKEAHQKKIEELEEKLKSVHPKHEEYSLLPLSTQEELITLLEGYPGVQQEYEVIYSKNKLAAEEAAKGAPPLQTPAAAAAVGTPSSTTPAKTEPLAQKLVTTAAEHIDAYPSLQPKGSKSEKALKEPSSANSKAGGLRKATEDKKIIAGPAKRAEADNKMEDPNNKLAAKEAANGAPPLQTPAAAAAIDTPSSTTPAKTEPPAQKLVTTAAEHIDAPPLLQPKGSKSEKTFKQPSSAKSEAGSLHKATEDNKAITDAAKSVDGDSKNYSGIVADSGSGNVAEGAPKGYDASRDDSLPSEEIATAAALKAAQALASSIPVPEKVSSVSNIKPPEGEDSDSDISSEVVNPDSSSSAESNNDFPM
jgi:hypothetical protein